MAERGPKKALSRRLLHWYDANARRLPWRVLAPESPDPYRIWLSEIMLQQTTVAAVAGYFNKFSDRWPTVQALAQAPLDDLLTEWAGLGYYARARNLHACAKIVAFELNGQFPRNEAELQKLPGVGPYTAAAIAAIAFDLPTAAVDGNAERVISRLYAIDVPLPASKPLIRKQAQALVPRKRAGDFAQAVMDLGATICTPKSPNCLVCPLSAFCEGFRRGIAALLPRKPEKKKVPVRLGCVYWVEREDGAVLLRRRPEKGLLSGMMEFPSTGWNGKAKTDGSDVPMIDVSWKKLPGQVEHTFTHFHLELSIFRGKANGNSRTIETDGYRWVHPRNFGGEALPTVMRKVAALVLSAGK
jgi:A/G-specific adenine glycosylase